ncbi:TPA: hypothetical protein QH134_004593, partial [Enterobacter hormaechei subsp. steigerwaltii]|nr:hypothetical protein [Enterobacter hormaechei subsp. steigerwaltii]
VKMPDFTIGIEDGVVVMKQPYKFSDQIGIDSGYTGMLKPFEIGLKPDGKKIYMSWKLEVHRSVGGDLVSQLLYSFYEDE